MIVTELHRLVHRLLMDYLQGINVESNTQELWSVMNSDTMDKGVFMHIARSAILKVYTSDKMKDSFVIYQLTNNLKTLLTGSRYHWVTQNDIVYWLVFGLCRNTDLSIAQRYSNWSKDREQEGRFVIDAFCHNGEPNTEMYRNMRLMHGSHR